MCLFLYDLYCPGARLQIWVCLIRAMSPYSNGAVQIRAGLELAVANVMPQVLVFKAQGRHVMQAGSFWADFCQKRSHDMMDASFEEDSLKWDPRAQKSRKRVFRKEWKLGVQTPCNVLDPFQANSGNILGPFQAISRSFRQFRQFQIIFRLFWVQQFPRANQLEPKIAWA